MLIVTTDVIPGRTYDVLGLVQGEIVQSKHFGKDLGAGFKTIVGGEIKGYTQMMAEARGIATRRMVEEAERMGADAVIGVRYSSSAVMSGAAEVLAFGTAIKMK